MPKVSKYDELRLRRNRYPSSVYNKQGGGFGLYYNRKKGGELRASTGATAYANQRNAEKAQRQLTTDNGADIAQNILDKSITGEILTDEDHDYLSQFNDKFKNLVSRAQAKYTEEKSNQTADDLAAAKSLEKQRNGQLPFFVMSNSDFTDAQNKQGEADRERAKRDIELGIGSDRDYKLLANQAQKDKNKKLSTFDQFGDAVKQLYNNDFVDGLRLGFGTVVSLGAPILNQFGVPGASELSQIGEFVQGGITADDVVERQDARINGQNTLINEPSFWNPQAAKDRLAAKKAQKQMEEEDDPNE